MRVAYPDASTSTAASARLRPDALLSARLLVAAALVLSATLSGGLPWLLALATVVVLGVPHGALDGEIARPLLRPRFGRSWFLVFAAPYLALASAVLLAWHVAPIATLAAFLAGSAWHFGTEDSEPGHAVEASVRGGLPIALPVLLHPAATAHVLGVASGTLITEPPVWLHLASLAWLASAVLWAGCLVLRRRWRVLAEPGLLAVMFAALPPLTAFAIYFVCLHAPRHMMGLAHHPVRAPRVRDLSTAALRSLPITGLTLLIGAGLWPFYAGDAPERLLALTLQGLAALTLPHMLLDFAAGRMEASVSARPLPE